MKRNFENKIIFAGVPRPIDDTTWTIRYKCYDGAYPYNKLIRNIDREDVVKIIRNLKNCTLAAYIDNVCILRGNKIRHVIRMR